MCLAYFLYLINRIRPSRGSAVEPPSQNNDESTPDDSSGPATLINNGELPSSSPASDAPPENLGVRIEVEMAPPDFMHLRLEGLEEYDRGGHLPVHLHESLGPGLRYRVIHKLGSGGFANVWLCQDTKFVDTIKYVALKIVAAHNSRDDCFETKLSLLQKTISSDRSQGICLPLDEFDIDGPNGTHLCFVYPLLGPKVSLGLHDGGTDPDKSLRRICYRLVQTLDATHQAGLCHNDLTTANVLHQVDGFAGLAEEEVLRILGEPIKLMVLVGEEPDHNEDGLPQYLVLPVDWHQVPKQYILEESKIIDFGESFFVAEPHKGCGTPMDYRAPEVILEKSPGIQSDLWALGCVLFEIRTGLRLFPSYNNEDEALARMVNVLGKLPEPWWSTTWVNRKRNFDDEVTFDSTTNLITEPTASSSGSSDDQTPAIVPTDPWDIDDLKSIQKRLQLGLWYDPPGRVPYIHRQIPPEEIEKLSDLLKQLLQFDPARRISAAEALKHDWFKM